MKPRPPFLSLLLSLSFGLAGCVTPIPPESLVAANDTTAPFQASWFAHVNNVIHKREQFAASPELIRHELSAAIRYNARQIAASLPQGNVRIMTVRHE